MDASLALAATVQVLHRLLEVGHLVTQPVVLTRLKLQLLLDVSHALVHLVEA